MNNLDPNRDINAAVATLAQHGYRAHRDARRAYSGIMQQRLEKR